MKTATKLPSGAYRTTVTLEGQRRSCTTSRRGCVSDDCRDCGRCLSALEELAQLAGELRRVRAQVSVGLLTAQEARRVARGRELTVAEAWERMTRTVPARSRRLVDSYWTSHLSVWFADKRLSEMTADVLAEWVTTATRNGYAGKTVRNVYDYLARSCRLLMPHELRELPWGDYRPPRGKAKQRERCRSLDEFMFVCEAARQLDRERWSRGRYADLSFRVVVAGLCGLRQGELSGLAWHDLRIDGGEVDDPAALYTLHVRRQVVDGERYDGAAVPVWQPKDGIKPPLRLHPTAVQVLRYQREQLQRFGAYRADGPVFPAPRATRDTTPHQPARWRTHADSIKPEQFRRLVRLAGLPDPEAWTTHSLRHTFATLELVAHGGDLRAVQQRTRHSSLAVMEGYIGATGRGAPPSRMAAFYIPPPALEGEDEAPAPVPSPAPSPAPELPAPLPSEAVRSALLDWAQAAQPGAEVFQREREAAARALRADSERPFLELARSWLAAGAPGAFPRPVAEAFRRAYMRGYSRAKRAGGSVEEWRAAGQRAHRATRAAWSAALRRAGGGAEPAAECST